MAEETITILKVGTDQAVESVKDLRENITKLKKAVDEAKFGTDDYREKLDELKVNQAALKDAMYATTQQGETQAENWAALTKAATGTSETYNSLVHRMAALKEQLRATDVSTEEGKQKFKDLAESVNDVNNKLKEMDAMQGNFQRNVGNYQSVFKGWAEHTDAFGKSLNVAEGSVNGFKDTFEALGKSPYLATFGILVSVVIKLADALKENDTAMAGVKKGMEALKPVMNFFSGVLETIASWIASIIEKVSDFITSNGIFQQIINGVMGVGNAILQFVISPFKGIVKAIEILKEDGVKGLGEAAKAFSDEMKNGVSFKQNYETGSVVADTIIAGAKSKSTEVKEAGKALAEDINTGVEEGLQLMDWEKALAKGEKKLEEERKRREEILKEANEWVDEGYEQAVADAEAYSEEMADIRLKDMEDEEAKAKAKVDILNSAASGTASILSSIADMYEADEESSEKNAGKIKALRIASATIETIQGALTAYSTAQELGPIAGPVVGAINAAAVTAAGIAQIAKIKSTSVSGESSSSSSLSSSSSATVSAPTVQTDVTNVRSLTSASEEERLNQMASSQKVYILQSDIEAAGSASKAQVTESSF